MADDDPVDPKLEAKRKEHAEANGLPLDRVKAFRLDPWAWAAARGLKPLPGREIPPEYRHLFEPPVNEEEAEARRSSSARARIYHLLVADEKMRRGKLPIE